MPSPPGARLARAGLRRALARAARTLLGPPAADPMAQLIHHDLARWEAYICAIEYVNYERVPGDVFELGVFAGASLALLAKAMSFDDKGMRRRLVGFDSFAGLPPAADEHHVWGTGSFAVNEWWHPTLPPGAAATPQAVADLFAACRLPPPSLEVGQFEDTIPRLVPSRHPEVALLHLDCDIYESTRDALRGVAPGLQDGCMLLFDDWFLYRGNPERGEARAFHEFLAEHPQWGAAHYRAYGTFCNSFILYRR